MNRIMSERRESKRGPWTHSRLYQGSSLNVRAFFSNKTVDSRLYLVNSAV